MTSAAMAGPFLPPRVVLDGFKERPEALAIQGLFIVWIRVFFLTGKRAGDKLYIGTSTGTVHMYALSDEQGS